MNQSDNSIRRQALDNRLFDDLDYYEQNFQREMTLGRYTAKQVLIDPSEVRLYLSHFVTSRTSDNINVKGNTDKWIDGQVIDAFAHPRLNKWSSVP